MKILLDSCISGQIIKPLQKAGHDVIWVGKWPTDPGDEEILQYAYKEKRILITLDKDFGEMAVVHELPHAGIIRLVNLSLTQQTQAILHVLKHYQQDAKRHALITVDPHKMRIRV